MASVNTGNFDLPSRRHIGEGTGGFRKQNMSMPFYQKLRNRDIKGKRVKAELKMLRAPVTGCYGWEGTGNDRRQNCKGGAADGPK